MRGNGVCNKDNEDGNNEDSDDVGNAKTEARLGHELWNSLESVVFLKHNISRILS